VERKLAAILSADVAGFSRLTALDEEGTLKTLDAYRAAIADFVAEHRGRVFGSAGDSIVAEFPSAVQAVRCAVAIQRSLHRRNADLTPDRRLEFRIGVNLGDVVISGEDLLGDAVNVAARLQEIAAPSGVCISGATREQIDGKLSFRLSNVGERTVKNIPRPIPVFRVDWQADDPSESGVLAGPPALPDKPSIAVLPFVNMSGDPEQEYFTDGITEDIITALSRYRWFFVIARNSSFAYKGKAVDIKQVARELGVRYVLEGSVRKAGRLVRVTGQLIDAETGAHLWAERYDRPYEDIFAIQDEITENVVGAIEPEILMGEGRRVIQQAKADPDAFDCCMRGMWHHYQMTLEEFVEAERWLRRAIEIDPKYARGHMALARVLFGRCVLGGSADIDADRAEICALATQAVALDERDPYCHYALFACHLLAGRHQAALAAAQRAIDLNPNFALGHLALGWVRIYIGHFDEALEPLLRAIRLSPHDPIGFLFLNRIALAHYHLGNYEEALHFAERAAAGRRIHIVLVVMIACLAMLGRLDEARALAAEIALLEPPDTAAYWRAVHPYAEPAHRAQLYDGLRRAGLDV
jgi:TolB-like protein/class 3 adenylate cyclase/Flp pilus assembly protein TadD